MQEPTSFLTFRYRGLFQSADISLFKKPLEQGFKIICEGNVKLPILKKSYIMSTEWASDLFSWTEHTPAYEKGSASKTIQRRVEHKDVIDPIGFFLMLDEGSWDKNSVNLLIGQRIVTLDVVPFTNGFEVRRREKDQKLIMHQENGRISKIEIPVPVIGSLSLQRVDS